VGLGDASYAVYLVHFLVISLLVASLSRLDRAPLNDLFCLAIAAIAVAMGVVFDRCIDRPLRRLCGRLRRPATGDTRAVAVSGS
jgi:peptidoglycan/LPS O-acetylase OafA/YrhL